MAPPIATPTPQRRGDGFTVMNRKLTNLFLDQFKSKSPTGEGLTHNTRRHLTTAFSGAVNSKGPPKSAVQSTQSLRTPLNNSSTPHIVSARSSYHSLDADDEDDINNKPERLDERLVPFSSTLRGARRLRIIDILQLKVQHVTLVIPLNHECTALT
jgi:hypothetical protein